jgi:hypothetical protein
MSLPGVNAPGNIGGKDRARKSKIRHKQILSVFQDASTGGRNIAEIYRLEVLPVKTRTIQLLGRKCPARIINTLLGFEVQASYKRVPCPDLVTARYLKLFMELGCRSIKLPYDPTVTDRLIPELELAMNRLSAGVRNLFPAERSLQVYVLRRIYSHLRSQLHSQ